jgi:hypothetical protein
MVALADKKISELVAATELDDTDLLVVVDSSKHETKKITLAQFRILGGFFSGFQSEALTDDLSYIGLTDTETIIENTNGVGNALTIDGSTTNYVNASGAALTTAPCLALALSAGTGVKEMLIYGFLRNDAWAWTPGSLLFLSVTPGLITHSPPTGAGIYVQVLGIARQTNIVFFNPSFTMVERTS